MPWLSVVVPVRNEAEGIAQALGPLQGLRDQLEIIVVDGGSEDDTAALAAPLADKVLASAPGRARQMNAGAAAATGEVLLFLHADTQLPEGFVGMIRAVIPAPSTVSPTPPYVIPSPPRVIPSPPRVIPAPPYVTPRHSHCSHRHSRPPLRHSLPSSRHSREGGNPDGRAADQGVPPRALSPPAPKHGSPPSRG